MKRRNTDYALAKKMVSRGRLPLIGVILVYKLLTVCLFMPLLRLIWAAGLRLSPVHYITNNNIGELFTSPFILAAALIMGILAAGWTLYEFSLILHGLDMGLRGQKFRLHRLFGKSLSDIRHVLRPRNVPMLLYAAVLIPFTNAFMTSDYISQLVVPEYIMETIRDNPLLSGVYLLVTLAAGVFAFLWIFSFSFFSLEGKDFREAAKESRSMISGKFFRTLWTLVKWNVWLMAKYMLLVLLVLILTGTAVLAVGNRNTVVMQAFGQALRYVGFPILGYLAECAITISQISFIAALYYRRRQERGELSGELEEQILSAEKKEKQTKWKRFKSGTEVPFAAMMAAAAVLTGFCTLVFSVVPEAAQMGTGTLSGKPAVVSCHRGYSAAAPENTLPAFQAAIDCGASFAELDVQMTKDGVVVVTHDTNLKRCTGVDANIYDLTFEQARQLDAGSFFSEEFAGTPLPTLEEVIQLCKGKIKLNIEIKQNGHSPELEKETVRIILENEFVDSCKVTSLNYESLCKVKEAAPQIKTGYILAVGVGNYYDLPNLDFFSVETTFITANMVKAIHQRGMEISAWTIDRETDARKMINLGVDDLITGDPKMVQSILEEDNVNWGSMLWDEFTEEEESQEELQEEPDQLPEEDNDMEQLLEEA